MKLGAEAKDLRLPTIIMLNQSHAGSLYQWMEGSGCRRRRLAIDVGCLMLLKADA